MIFFRIALLLLTGAALLGAQAHAQPAWPARPIRIIVPYAPGGSSDVLARLLQPALTASLGQAVVVENRPGAATVVGSEVVARSAPDGHTLLLADVAFALLPAITERMPYDTIADFAPVTQMGVAPLLLVVRGALPAANLAEFLARARAEPERLTYGSGGTFSHIVAEMFQATTGTRLTRVPYRGGAPAATDLASGTLDAMMSNYATIAALYTGGQIRALGAMSATRLPDLPTVPTLREQGADLTAEFWWGMSAPARTPAPIVARLAEAIAAALRAPDLASRLATLGIIPRAEGPGVFDALIRADLERYGAVARAHNIRAQ